MSWLSTLAQYKGHRRTTRPRRHPGLLDGRTLESGHELLFLNFNATMGVTPDGRIQRAPQLASLVNQRPNLRVVLTADAQRSMSDYRHLMTLLPQIAADRLVGVATTAAGTSTRYEVACERFAVDFEASAIVAVDAFARGYSDRCEFLVVTPSSGMDETVVERCQRVLQRQLDASGSVEPLLHAKVRDQLQLKTPIHQVLSVAGLVRS